MAVIATKYIDGYGNNFQVGYTILSQKNNVTTYRRWINLNVVSGGHVAYGSSVLEFYNPFYQKGGSGVYYAGTYTIGSQDIARTHQDGQPYTETISGKIDTPITGRWDFSGTVTFPAMDSATPITAFNGEKLKGDLNVTFTAKTGYTYKLQIQLNGDNTAIDTFNSYTSGGNVRLSAETVAYIQSKNKNETIPLRATLLSYKSGNLIGTKSATHSVSNTKGLHLMINGSWKEAIPYVRINGAWKECTPYVMNNQWKEGI